jgi:hypothetical protein
MLIIGAAGFEPATPATQTRCDTRLRHAPKLPSSLLPLGAQPIHPGLQSGAEQRVADSDLEHTMTTAPSAFAQLVAVRLTLRAN